MGIGRAIGRGIGRAGALAGMATANVLGATPLVGAAGVIGAGAMKGSSMFGSKGKDPKVEAITPLSGESSTDAVTEVLKKILVDTTAIHNTLRAREIPESEKKELALDAKVRHRELIEAALSRKGDDEDDEDEESLWDKLKKWMFWIMNPKTWIKALMGSLIVKSLLGFMVRVGAFLLGPVGLALLAVLVVAINWKDIKVTVSAFVQKVKDYVQAMMDVTGISALIDVFSTGTEDVDDFAAVPVVPMEMDDPVGDAEFEAVEEWVEPEVIPEAPEAFADPSILEDQLEEVPPQPDAEEGRMNILITKGDDDLTEVEPTKLTGTMGTGGVSMAIPTLAALSRSFQQEESVQPQTELTGTMGEGGVSMQIPTLAALSRAFHAKEEPEPLSEEEQFKEDLRARGASEEAIASVVRRKFRSEWEQSLTPDEERKQAKMEEAGASEKAIKHSIQMDRSAREKGFKNQNEYLASIPEKGEKKQTSMWVLPKDTTPQTYNEGWQVKKGYGEWEDVADQKVPTIMGEKGLSTLSHVRYRQKEGSKDAPASSGKAVTSLFKAPKKDEEDGTTTNIMSLFKSVLPSATVTTGGNQVQLGMNISGAGRVGNRVITVTTNTDMSQTYQNTSSTKSITQQGMSVNNNHTQPPQTGRDA
jgi:hypothetical protein